MILHCHFTPKKVVTTFSNTKKKILPWAIIKGYAQIEIGFSWSHSTTFQLGFCWSSPPIFYWKEKELSKLSHLLRRPQHSTVKTLPHFVLLIPPWSVLILLTNAWWFRKWLKMLWKEKPRQNNNRGKRSSGDLNVFFNFFG